MLHVEAVHDQAGDKVKGDVYILASEIKGIRCFTMNFLCVCWSYDDCIVTYSWKWQVIINYLYTMLKQKKKKFIYDDRSLI